MQTAEPETKPLDRDLAGSTGVLNPLVLVDRMIEKNIDPMAMKQMMELALIWKQNQAAEAFAQAITGFQAECSTVFKSRAASFDEKDQGGNKTGNKVAAYKFASYDDIMNEAQPILATWGIVVTFNTDAPVDGRPGLSGTCRIRVGTHVEETHLFLPIPAMKVNDTQKFGAALSYLKRYLLCAALNIVCTDKDDDGAGQFDVLDAEQLKEIERLCKEIEDVQAKATAAGAVIDRPFLRDNFLAWLEVKDLKDVPATKFKEARHFLASKLENQREKTAKKGGK